MGTGAGEVIVFGGVVKKDLTFQQHKAVGDGGGVGE